MAPLLKTQKAAPPVISGKAASMILLFSPDSSFAPSHKSAFTLQRDHDAVNRRGKWGVLLLTCGNSHGKIIHLVNQLAVHREKPAPVITLLSSSAALIQASDLTFSGSMLVRLYFSFQLAVNQFTGNFQIVASLQIDPELGSCAEITSEAKCSISRYAPLFQDNFIDAPGRHMDFLCKPVLADAHRNQKLLA
jgi:hypothetical protein